MLSGVLKAVPPLDAEELSLLRHLLSNPVQVEPLSTLTPSQHDRTGSLAHKDGLKGWPASPGRQHTQDEMNLTRSLKHPINRLAYLNQLAKAARKVQQQVGGLSTAALAQLPATAFSELLRSLDPVDALSSELDPTNGMHVGPGMAQSTPLGNEIDVWGVRKRYVNVLVQAMNAAKLRLEAGRDLLLSDYKMLLRCAGAACDLDSVQAAWDMMANTGLRDQDPEAYLELARARFLTEPLYAQYDLARFRVRPINLHMEKLWIMGRKQRQYLRILGHNMLRRQRHHFGHNRRSLGHVEHLTRFMRRSKPPYLMLQAATRLCYIVDERLLCAVMVALARSGSIRLFQDQVLKKYWGVHVSRPAGAEGHVTVQAVVYAADSPLRPSERLLEAIVSSYCINAEFSLALKVLDAVSSCYAIPIPDKVWFDLLEWAYVLSSKPASTEWKILNRQFRGTKGVGRNAVQMVWDAMTAEPYNVQPGLYQYQLLARDLISRSLFSKALDVVLELEPMYRALLAELEGAFCKHALSSALGVEVAASEMAWRRARARKHAALYRLQTMCRALLKQVCDGNTGAHTTVRGVPQFIEAFRDLLPDNISYPIQTGFVQIYQVGHVPRLERTTSKFTELPVLTGDTKVANPLARLRPKTVEMNRLGPAPHVSLHNFLTKKPSWPHVLREFS